MGPVRQNPIHRTVSLFICVRNALCTIVAHNIAQNRPDNFPSYPLDNHHCSDDVYLREGGPADQRTAGTHHQQVLLQQFDAADALHAQNARRRTRTDVVDDQTTFRQSLVDARHVTLDRPRRRLCQDITRHTALQHNSTSTTAPSAFSD